MKMNKHKLLIVIVLVLMLVDVQGILAQCPMCRMSAESNLAHGGTEGKGLNKGILYMFAMPYLLVMALGFLWWRNNGRVTEKDGVNN